jgi:hypothetical protein
MTNATAPATAAKIRAAVWTRTDKTSWNVEYNGYSFAGVKTDGTWSLIVWNEIADDWADAYVTAETALRPFWNAVTAWLPTSDYVTPNPLEGYSVTEAAVESITAEHEADAAIQLAEAEGVRVVDEAASAAVHTMIESWTDTCPKCGMFGDDKCVTKSGKPVKENGGYHAVRPGHGK